MKVRLCDMFAVGMIATEDDLKEYPRLRECKANFIYYGSKWVYTDQRRVKEWIEDMSKEVSFNVDGATYLKFRQLKEDAHLAGWQIEQQQSKPKQIKMPF